MPYEQTSRDVWAAMSRWAWASLALRVLWRAPALLWQAAGSVSKLREEVVRQVGAAQVLLAPLLQLATTWTWLFCVCTSSMVRCLNAPAW